MGMELYMISAFGDEKANDGRRCSTADDVCFGLVIDDEVPFCWAFSSRND